MIDADLALPIFLDRTIGLSRAEIDAMRKRLNRREARAKSHLKNPPKRASKEAKALGVKAIGFKIGRGQ